MFNLAESFKELFRDVYNKETLAKDHAEKGSTYAGIMLNRRIEALTAFIQVHGDEIIEALDRDQSRP